MTAKIGKILIQPDVLCRLKQFDAKYAHDPINPSRRLTTLKQFGTGCFALFLAKIARHLTYTKKRTKRN
ncbi:MAG: hypothetical protein HUK16_06670 [Bacteroidales bacterium]|nr:hypothetical protein [Bacteroidales bacterium]